MSHTSSDLTSHCRRRFTRAFLPRSPTPIDPSDASTTGLFDVDTADWDHEVLSCVMGEVEGSGSGAEELKELLGPVGWNVGEPVSHSLLSPPLYSELTTFL